MCIVIILKGRVGRKCICETDSGFELCFTKF